jgi:DNA polymerase-3 subunit alpha
VEPLDKAAATMVTGLEIFVRDSAPLESIAARLTNGGRAPVRLIVLMEKGREVHVSLGNKFTVTPQIKGAIKAISGVVDVQDF